MACRLTANITKENCEYQIAGVRSIYLINFDTDNQFPLGANGEVDSITLANNAKAYKIDFIDNTASWTDDLAVNGSGGKYRTHTLNFTLSDYSYKILNQEKALSLNKFTAVVVDKSGRTVILGRLNGLSATSFNYASGAAEADALGWTTVMAGTENEIGKLLKSESIIAALVDTPKDEKIVVID